MSARDRIELIEKIDELKSNWFVWKCIRGDIHGQVQADYSGELIAEDTFESDE